MAATLSRGEVRKALKKLRALGIKPPRIGYCVTVVPSGPHYGPRGRVVDYYGSGGRVELCRHPRSRYIPNDTGYQIVTSRRDHGLFGARRRRRRR